MKVKMKNRSHRYNTNWAKPRHGNKYSKYKKCFKLMMLLCIKQHLSHIWNSIHEEVNQHQDQVEEKLCL